MRQILVDEFRSRAAVRHGGDLARATLTEGLPEGGADVGELLAVDEALRKLEQLDPDLAELVEWHFFAGISFVDIAAARGVTERTVRRHWDAARAILTGVL
jgi:DNA-directed RNA polymerase specialized sigma24 family protein